MFDSSNSKFISIDDLVQYEASNSVSPSIIDGFTNESAALVAYLQTQAHAESVSNVSKTFLLITSDHKQVLGFFSIAMSSIQRNVIRAHGMPYMTVPAALIGRLGRSLNHVGCGIGELLLFESFKNVVSIAQYIGVKVILTDAKDTNAQDFYQSYGFKPVRQQATGVFPFKLYLSLDTAKEAVASY